MKLACLAIGLIIAGTAAAADPTLDAKLEPAEISLGQTATLTIRGSGDDLPRIVPPAVPGLQFTVVGQSRRIESINGVTSSSFSSTYQVRAQQAGTYIIASIARGLEPLTLRVDAPGSRSGAPPAVSGSPPQPATSGAPGDTQVTADGTAFVRLLVPTHELYVGQSIPVEIQVGTRDGMVASLNGLPTLNGDAFTLDRLSSDPEQRSAETIDGKPFTVFRWHGVLAPVKPGALSLSMETPLTVRIPTQRPGSRFLNDSSLDELFDDPAFQGLFGGSIEKEVTVSSPPARFTVLDLPVAGRPKDFSGAVGQFQIRSELSNRSATAGDPLTLRLKISGEGNFDRVNSTMLAQVDHWKTYQPTARFAAADTPFRGEKTFEQPIVATEAGEQTLPALTFSYFDPETRRYDTLSTPTLTVEVAPAAVTAAAAGAGVAAGTGAATGTGAAAGVAVAAASAPAAAESVRRDGLRPDHPPAAGYGSLLPPYLQPRYVALPSLLVAALPLAWFWLRRREQRDRSGAARAAARPADPAQLREAMDRAIHAGNVRDFFAAVRTLLRTELSARWQLAPEAVTMAEVEARLGADSDVRKLFALADEALYSGRRFAPPELERWRRLALLQSGQQAAA
jgi:hypothetical protein